MIEGRKGKKVLYIAEKAVGWIWVESVRDHKPKGKYTTKTDD